MLSPQQQAALDQLLAAWEARNATVRTWSCTFHKWEYNAWSPADAAGERLAFAESTGELKYAAPDKGLFRVRESKQWNPEARRYEVRSGEAGEHWVCNGESIFDSAIPSGSCGRHELPPEMRGKAISDGPLPFVFGAKADTLKKRYWMRDHHPAGGPGSGLARGAAPVPGRCRELFQGGADPPGPRSDAVRDPDLQAGRAGPRCLSNSTRGRA